ncbi:50S ribosomal protein L2 [Gammaproteobacteria bacterium]|nr:50S ribosomal protein L2 [Gammaproteobacteria bacterium]
MAVIRKHKPTSPGVRHKVSIVHDHLHKEGPFEPLVVKINRSHGRNSAGEITCRHKGGGHKQRYRMVDFKRNEHDGVIGRVKRIEYDPNRTAHIALISYENGAWSYIVATDGLREGHTVSSGQSSEIKPGNCLPMSAIPVGSTICCIEMRPGKGAQIARTAGANATLAGKDGNYAIIRLKSGEVRKILLSCRAVIGVVSNSQHGLKKLGKAGAKRHRGVRPTVRGVAMNPVDHPHGGGEGRTSGGRHPCSPTGLLAKGKKTRSNKRTTGMIVKRRTKKRR